MAALDWVETGVNRHGVKTIEATADAYETVAGTATATFVIKPDPYFRDGRRFSVYVVDPLIEGATGRRWISLASDSTSMSEDDAIRSCEEFYLNQARRGPTRFGYPVDNAYESAFSKIAICELEAGDRTVEHAYRSDKRFQMYADVLDGGYEPARLLVEMRVDEEPYGKIEVYYT